ncbi:unnamed protein product [Prunus armeniaca]|uniref:Ribosomal protein mS38 C-terminal domain-containing protein n=1 Tax=Prunus armeniaca TaxID=36596 RepID=A0A6J5UGV3_PRUAR|nr:unnamed protein product [Prunus armeniaca]
MASTIQRVLRRSQPTRIIDALHNAAAPNLILHQPNLDQTNPDPHQILNLSPLLVVPKTQNFGSYGFSHIFPSFPFGICLNPISSSGLVSSEAEEVEFDDSRKVWADSVKKKRKRKMNKHKYRKLRKRLQRQT